MSKNISHICNVLKINHLHKSLKINELHYK